MEIGGNTVALKELPDRLAEREYLMLERLLEEHLPGVSLVGIATERFDPDGQPLEGVLVTRHLPLLAALPLAVQRPAVRSDAGATVDGRARRPAGSSSPRRVFQGDCSLNNALFRRDAGALRARRRYGNSRVA